MSVVRRKDILRSEEIIERLGLQGITLPPRPDYERPHLPRDLTSLDDEAIMDLFAQLNEWHNFLAVKAAAAAVDEKEALDADNVEQAKALIRNWAGTSGEKVTIARAQRDADPQVASYRQTLTERYATRKLLETLSGNAERDVFLVSREVTRRTGGQAQASSRRANRFTA